MTVPGLKLPDLLEPQICRGGTIAAQNGHLATISELALAAGRAWQGVPPLRIAGPLFWWTGA